MIYPKTYQPKFNKGDFIQNVDPYPGEGEYMVIDYDHLGNGDFYGYKCARMKGKHVSEQDFQNLIIIDKWHEDSYKKVG